MPDAANIVLVTELPEFCMADGMLQFTLISGKRTHIFRISQHKARSAIHLALRTLDAAAEQPSNVAPLRRAPRGNV